MGKTIGIVVKPGAPRALAALETVAEVAGDARFLIEASGHHALDGFPQAFRLASSLSACGVEFHPPFDQVLLFTMTSLTPLGSSHS